MFCQQGNLTDIKCLFSLFHYVVTRIFNKYKFSVSMFRGYHKQIKINLILEIFVSLCLLENVVSFSSNRKWDSWNCSEIYAWINYMIRENSQEGPYYFNSHPEFWWHLFSSSLSPPLSGIVCERIYAILFMEIDIVLIHFMNLKINESRIQSINLLI